MCARRIARRAMFAVVATALLTAGCGGGGEGTTRTLNIHVSGQLRYAGDEIRAQYLAWEDAGKRAGRFKIRLIVRDEASPDNDLSDHDRVRRNAKEAARDPNAVAYVGDLDLASIAISAPILNRAGLLQVPPSATYSGLTRAQGAQPGEPAKYRPTGRRTLARVMPADHVKARAGVVYARTMGVKRLGIVADDTPFDEGLRTLVLTAARELGLDAVPGGAGSWAKQARRVTAAGADGVYVAACGQPAEMLDFVKRVPRVKVFTGECYLGAWRDQPVLAGRFFVTAAGGGLGETPAGRRWNERWLERVGTAPNDRLVFSYEAMSAVLAAIERAGTQGDDRAAVVREFFAIRNRQSVLGRYSIDRHGDSTLRSYGGFTWRDGSLSFDRVLDTGA